MATKDIASKSALEEVSEPPEDQQKTNLDTALSDSNDGKTPPPLAAKLFAVALIACISFGSHWSSGVTGAMKSTIKKVAQALNQISPPLTYCYAENGHQQRPIFPLGSQRRLHGYRPHAA